MNKKAVAAAIALALCSGAQAQSNSELKRELDDLRRQIQELKELLKAKADAPPAASPGGSDADEATKDSLTPATQADVKGLRSDLENYKYENARQLERKVPGVARNTTIKGTVQVRVSDQSAVQNAGVSSSSTTANTTFQAAPRHWSFDVPFASLVFSGQLYRDYQEGKNLTYSFGLQGSSNFAGNPSSATSAAQTLGRASGNGSQFNIADANIAYSFMPTNGGLEDPKLTLTLGQQLIPFGLEGQASEEVRPVITSAQFLSRSDGYANLSGRQIGLILRGDAWPTVDYTSNYRGALLEYNLGIVNGSTANKSDNNNKKDWVGRIAFTLPAEYTSWLREIKLGASFYRGDTNLVSTNTSNAAANNAVVGIGKANRTGVDFSYTHFPWALAYEYVIGKDQTLTSAAKATLTNHPDFVKQSRGQYINLAYTWGEQFITSSKNIAKYDDFWPLSYQAFVRYDVFDADTRETIKGDKTYITTVGLNAFFAETTKLQLNYLLTHNDLALGSTYSLDRPRKNQGLQVQFQYGF